MTAPTTLQSFSRPSYGPNHYNVDVNRAADGSLYVEIVEVSDTGALLDPEPLRATYKGKPSNLTLFLSRLIRAVRSAESIHRLFGDSDRWELENNEEDDGCDYEPDYSEMARHAAHLSYERYMDLEQGRCHSPY